MFNYKVDNKKAFHCPLKSYLVSKLPFLLSVPFYPLLLKQQFLEKSYERIVKKYEYKKKNDNLLKGKLSFLYIYIKTDLTEKRLVVLTSLFF